MDTFHESFEHEQRSDGERPSPKGPLRLLRNDSRGEAAGQWDIIQALIEHARKDPDKTAVIDFRKGIFSRPGSRRFTFGGMLGDVRTAASRLKELGFGKGDRIVVCTQPSYELFSTALAVLFIGASVVFIDNSSDRKQIADACRSASPRGIIGIEGRRTLRAVPEVRSIPVKVPDKSLFARGRNPVSPEEMSPEELHADDEAMVTFAGESSGLYRGTRLTHGTLSEQIRTMDRHLECSPRSICLTALPSSVFTNLVLGIMSVLTSFNPARPDDFDPSETVRRIKEYGVTMMSGHPAFFEKIADHLLDKGAACYLDTLYACGGPVLRPLAWKLGLAFPGARGRAAYGPAGAGPCSMASFEEVLDAGDMPGLLLGRRDEGIDVRILRPVTGPVLLARGEALGQRLAGPGEAGEIILSGALVIGEFMGSPEAFHESTIVENGTVWHRTGDAGLIDVSENIFLLGSINNPLRSSGVIRYALPYEQALMEKQGVAFAAVLEVKGKLHAVVEPEPGWQKARRSLLIQAREALEDLRAEPFSVTIMRRIPRGGPHGSRADLAKLRGLLA